MRFTGEEAKIPRHVYVYATGYNPTPFTRFRNQVIGQGNWELHEVGGSHDVMADEPERLLQIVLGLSADCGEHQDLLVNLDLKVPAFASKFARVAEVVVEDPTIRAAARESFRFYREQGYPLQDHRLQRL